MRRTRKANLFIIKGLPCPVKPRTIQVVSQIGKALPQGLKPVLILRNLMYGLKPVPFKLTHNHNQTQDEPEGLFLTPGPYSLLTGPCFSFIHERLQDKRCSHLVHHTAVLLAGVAGLIQNLMSLAGG